MSKKTYYSEGTVVLLRTHAADHFRFKDDRKTEEKIFKVIKVEDPGDEESVSTVIDDAGETWGFYTSDLKRATKAQIESTLLIGDVVQVKKDSYWYESRGVNPATGRKYSFKINNVIVKTKSVTYDLIDLYGSPYRTELKGEHLEKIHSGYVTDHPIKPGVGDKFRIKSSSSYHPGQAVDSTGKERIFVITTITKDGYVDDGGKDGELIVGHCTVDDYTNDYRLSDIEIIEKLSRTKDATQEIAKSPRALCHGAGVVLKKESKYYETEGVDEVGMPKIFFIDGLVPKESIIKDEKTEEPIHDVRVEYGSKVYMYPYEDLEWEPKSSYTSVPRSEDTISTDYSEKYKIADEKFLGENSISMRQMENVLSKVYDNHELRKSSVPLFIGNPGLGKTKMIELFAKERGVKLVELITSQMSPFEISGIAMPDKDTKKMTYFNFDKIEELKDGDILFFDELLNGNPTVLNACLTILEQRRLISGKPLPNLMIVAAANPQGMVPLTPQIKERFIWYNVDFAPNLWMDFMENKYQMPRDISAKLCDLIVDESFETSNFNTPRSIDKAVAMLIADCPTPYISRVRPILSQMFTNAYRETKIKVGEKFLNPGESVTWLDLQKKK